MMTGDNRFDLQDAREADRLISNHPRNIPASSLSGSVAYLLARWDDLETVKQERDTALRKLANANSNQRLQIAVTMMAAMIAAGNISKGMSHELLEACSFEIANDMLAWPEKQEIP